MVVAALQETPPVLTALEVARVETSRRDWRVLSW
jgi:hypothetical protein